MRVLVDDLTQVSAAQYRRFVQRSQLCGLLPDGMVNGEPYLALNGVVLRAADAAVLQPLTSVFARAFHRAGSLLARDVPALVEMGFPWVAAELLAAEVARQPLVGRFDFAQDERGHWWLLEFNADTPSGIREAIVADRLVYERLPAASHLERPNQDMEGMFTRAFCEAAEEMPKGSALGLVTNASELEDLAQMAYTRNLLRPALAAEGIDVVLGDVDNLQVGRRGLTLCGRSIGILYRYVPIEAMLGKRPFPAIFEAVLAGRLRLLNGLYGLLLQHKGLLAWLWRHRNDPLFEEDERAAINRHLPPTWWIGDFPASEDYRAYVVKQVFGREGEEVYLGVDLTAQDWQMLSSYRTFVTQKYVPIAALNAAVPTTEGFQIQPGYATVGAFTVQGYWAGYFTRFGGKITTSRAKWFGTYLDQGVDTS